MAIVCCTLGRRAASCSQLETYRRVTAFKPFTFNAAPRSCVALGDGNEVFCRGIPTCFPYCWSNHFLNNHATDGVVSAKLWSCGQFLGLSTFAGGGTNGTAPARHVLRVPSLGDSVRKGTILEWRVGIGSMVQEQDVLCVLETDEVTVEIHADVAGCILSLAADLGGTVFVGNDLAVIEPLSPEAAAEARVERSPSTHQENATSPGAVVDKNGLRHAGQAASSAAKTLTGSASSFSRVHRPLISFRNARKRLEMLGLLPSQRQSVRERRDKEEKEELQRPAPPGSSSVVVR